MVLIYSSIVVMEDIFVKSSFRDVANSKTFFAILLIAFGKIMFLNSLEIFYLMFSLSLGLQLFCLALVYSLYKDMELEIVLNYRRSLPQYRDLQVQLHYEGIQRKHELDDSVETNRKLKTKTSNLPVKLEAVKKSKSRRRESNKVK